MEALHVRTPLWPSAFFGRRVGREVLLKMDAFQPGGSFKLRGMGRLVQDALRRGRRRFVCPSGGNAGIAAAVACRQLSASLTVLLPEKSRPAVHRRLAEIGAEVLLKGRDWDESHEAAIEHCERIGAELLHPFDHEQLWEGHSTLIDELHEQMPGPPGGIVVAVGGGGLLGGVILGLRRVGWDRVPVIACETRGAASFAAAVNKGEVATLPAIRSIAASLGARRVSAEVFRLAGEHDVHSRVVSDRQALDGVLDLLDAHRVLVEPACGAALAAVSADLAGAIARGPLVVIACGGAGVSLSALEAWAEQLAPPPPANAQPS